MLQKFIKCRFYLYLSILDLLPSVKNTLQLAFKYNISKIKFQNWALLYCWSCLLSVCLKFPSRCGASLKSNKIRFYLGRRETMDSNRRQDYRPHSTGRLSVTLRELTSAGLGWAQARDRHWSCPTLHYGEKYPAWSGKQIFKVALGVQTDASICLEKEL